MEIYYVITKMPVYEVGLLEITDFSKKKPTYKIGEELFFPSLIHAMDFCKDATENAGYGYIGKARLAVDGSIEVDTYNPPLMYFKNGEVFPNVDKTEVETWVMQEFSR